MSTINITKGNFNDIINNNANVVLDFWAGWCGPCKMFGPTFEKVSKDYKDVIFGKINVDEEPELSGEFGIRGIPTVGFIANTQVTFLEAGIMREKELRAVIDDNKTDDMEY